MGKDINPQFGIRPHNSNLHWQFSNTNSASNNQQFGIKPHNSNLMLFPTYVNPYGCIFSVNSATPFPGLYTNKSSQKTSPLIPSQHPPEYAGPGKRYLVIDRLRDGRSCNFSSSNIPCMNSTNPGFDLQGSTETNVSNRNGTEEMHEDTEEINALLYSDSDDYHEDEEASTGHSPAGASEGTSKVASSMLPAKRRRVDVNDEFDAVLIDTASSKALYCPDAPTKQRNKEDSDDTKSSCIKEVDHNRSEQDRQLKRARIRETVSILRRIIPGAHGKDAVTVLDEAINYLKSLKLKAKSLNASP
ncbi:transcription factor bHLH143 [Canna indica]|uniref:Transcription factor bHLH143 n=1 Tax=Canna indica TaxID=4628 RepID=A0AAQ3L0I0_9LILI|nr:transcription factor bHLH143 [Canna indica]